MYSIVNHCEKRNTNQSDFFASVCLYLSIIVGLWFVSNSVVAMGGSGESIKLPKPKFDSEISLEQALNQRRSVRRFKRGNITLAQLSQLLWAAQGITNSRGFRTTPSAGRIYPLNLYVVASRVDQLAAGMYKYQPRGHRLINVEAEDRRAKIPSAALGQRWIRRNAALLVFSAAQSRAIRKYGDRGVRYIHMEVGHAAQNVLLQASALGLGVTVVGAFNDHLVNKLLELSSDEQVLYLLPVGLRRK